MSAADFEDLLTALTGPTNVDDLKAQLADRVNHRTALPDAVAWLVDVVGTDPVVRALVDAGGLVQPTVGARVLVASWASDGEVGDPRFVPAAEAEMHERLYRRAVEADRG